jgi:pentatricopeptide repeat protein
MYVKCESIREARETFDRLEIRDVVTWGTMIHGYIAHEQYFDAFRLFEAMKVCGVLPNSIILQCLLQACKALEDIKRVRMLHCQIYDLGLELNPCMSNAIVHMYCKSGSLNDARRVFCMSSSSGNSQSWDYLLAQYAEHGHFTAALGLYAKMQEEGIFPRRSPVLMHVLKACEGLGEGCFDKATLIHHHIIEHSFDVDEAPRSALLTLYAKCGSIKEARNVFDTFPTPPDVVSWGAMMAGYVYQGDSLPALQLFKEMLGQGIQPSEYVLSCILKACSGLYALEQGRWIHDHLIRSGFELNVVVNSCVVDLYAKCGHLQDADDVFVNLSNRDSTSWGAMIAGYASSGEIDKAFDCFQQMQEEGVLVDKVVCSSILKASGIRRNIRQGRLVCDEIIRAGINVDVILANSIIDMFAKCGALADARKSFDLFPRKDLVSWGAMIGGYVANDEGIHALKLFETMQKDGIAPNNVLYLSILKACGSTRMTRLIRFIHDQILRNELESDRAVSNTLINMYGKCGSFVDAQKVLDNLPGADVISWASMVSGLSRDGNSTELAQQYLKDMNTCGLTKKPEGASFINMLSACTHAGTVADGLNFFEGVTGNCGGRSSLTLAFYSCMIDLLGRTGHLKEADNLIQTMPSFPDSITWSSVLSSCKIYGHTNLGKQCFLEAGT